LILGIDEKSLNSYGKWPFRRYVHSKVTDYCTTQNLRENSIFFDIFFTEPDRENPEDDSIFIESIRKNNNVIFDYFARDDVYENENEKNEMQKRVEKLTDKFGELKNIYGNSDEVLQFNGFTPPLIPYIESLKNAGIANAIEDGDKIIRNYPLIAKSLIVNTKDFSDLKEGERYDAVDVETLRISYNNDNSCYLSRSYVRVYDQLKSAIKNRKPLTKNNIYSIKERMDKTNGDFQLELDNFRSTYEKQNRQIVKNIKSHIIGSRMPVEFKDQINQVFGNEENLKDTDELLYELSANMNKAQESDKKFKDDALFFTKLYEQCIKLDRTSEENIYDYLYKGKKFYFDRLRTANEKYFMSIALTLACEYFHVGIDDVEVILGKEIRLKNPKIYDDKTEKYVIPRYARNNYIGIPIDGKGLLRINYAGAGSTPNPSAVNPTTFKVISYSDFTSGTKQYYIGNKILMVGAFAKGMADDMYQTPFKTMYGIEIIANSLNTMILNYYIMKPPSAVNLILMLLISILVAFIASNNNILRAYVYTILFITVYFGFAVLLFSFTNVALETIKIVIITILSLMSVIVYRAMTEEKQKKMIKSTFAKYVNASVVEQLIKNPPELGGVDMDITIQFSDIRGFTTLSESMQSQDLVKLLNRYLNEMTNIIIETNGTLDKYIGDAIMCFWGAPNPQNNHTELACIAALKQIENLKELNSVLPEAHKLKIGIGLNSGIVTVGNMGSNRQMNYTVMGDNVNLGSRLEGLNKNYGTSIIVSEYTYASVKDKFIFRELDNIKVKGKNKPVKIYELLALKDDNL
jgi:class 3 adenylate cyclase/CHASE2 domain-containing sensor protein